MTFEQVKNKKAELFERIMMDKYNKVETPTEIVKEYRFLQREEKRLIKSFNQAS